MKGTPIISFLLNFSPLHNKMYGGGEFTLNQKPPDFRLYQL